MRCGACGQELSEGARTCPHCGQLVLAPMPAPPEFMPGVVPIELPSPYLVVGRLGLVTAGVLVATAIVLLVRSFSFDQNTTTDLGYLTAGLFLTAAALVVIWSYRVRTNVTGRGRQRLARAWAVWGWICPVVNLWFPLLIISDVENTDLPPTGRLVAMRIRGLWWACWLISNVSGAHLRNDVTVAPDGTTFANYAVGVDYGGTPLSRLSGAAAAILLALTVYRISVRQESVTHGLVAGGRS